MTTYKNEFSLNLAKTQLVLSKILINSFNLFACLNPAIHFRLFQLLFPYQRYWSKEESELGEEDEVEAGTFYLLPPPPRPPRRKLGNYSGWAVAPATSDLSRDSSTASPRVLEAKVD